MADKICASCAAWQPPPPESPEKSMGQCRRHPPTPFVMQVQVGKIMSPGQHPQKAPTLISAWPPAPDNGGCWDWVEEKAGEASNPNP